jgi:hypothetical protein
MTTAVPADLPAAVTAALEQVQADLIDLDPAPDPAERALADDVRRYLRQRVRDPLSRALLDRPEILDWCVHRALRRTGPASRRGDSGLYRRAEPLSEPATVAAPATSEAAPEPTTTTRTRRTRGDAREKKS